MKSRANGAGPEVFEQFEQTSADTGMPDHRSSLAVLTGLVGPIQRSESCPVALGAGLALAGQMTALVCLLFPQQGCTSALRAFHDTPSIENDPLKGTAPFAAFLLERRRGLAELRFNIKTDQCQPNWDRLLPGA